VREGILQNGIDRRRHAFDGRIRVDHAKPFAGKAGDRYRLKELRDDAWITTVKIGGDLGAVSQRPGQGQRVRTYRGGA